MDTSNPYLYLQIAESIRRRIAAGELKPGDRLPPVRAMAEQWDCTPGTVSRAYQTLTQEGLVTGRRGKGTLVAPSLIQSPSSTWSWAALVNRAEHLLLEAINAGHSPAEVETALSIAVARWRELQAQAPQPTRPEPAAGEPSLQFAGSHDLVVDLLPQLLESQAHAPCLSLQYSGSLGGLIALARGEADFAGAHLWDEQTDTYNLPFVQRLLPGRRIVLLTLAHRQLGLILPRDNPQGIAGLQDLAQPEVRFINRQPGSGSRVWLNAHLKRLGIDPAAIAGFDHEVTTHLAVASAVAEGEATAGLGLYAAAASFDLDFIPLTRERYDLVIPAALWSTSLMQALIAMIRSPRLQESIAALGGYDSAETGRETWVG